MIYSFTWPIEIDLEKCYSIIWIFALVNAQIKGRGNAYILYFRIFITKFIDCIVCIINACTNADRQSYINHAPTNADNYFDNNTKTNTDFHLYIVNPANSGTHPWFRTAPNCANHSQFHTNRRGR